MFWTRIHILYNKNMQKANSRRESDPSWKILPTDWPKGSLKSQWYTRLQPAIQKFAGIVDKQPPASGHIQDDPKMDLYWKSIRLFYSEQATEGLPTKFILYMQAYFFITSSQFALVLESNEKSGIKRKGCKPKAVSDNLTVSAIELSWKQPRAATRANSQCPVGCNSAKKQRQLISLSIRLQRVSQRLLRKKLHRLCIHRWWKILNRA